MLSALRKVLSFEMTITEWIGTAVMLAAPYRIIGVLWPLIHSKDFANRHGLDRAVSVLGSIVVAGAVAVDGVPGMRPADCRIDIRRRTRVGIRPPLSPPPRPWFSGLSPPARPT